MTDGDRLRGPAHARDRVAADREGAAQRGRPSTYVVEAYGSDIGPLHGARVVARAWTDPAFKERLLEDATAAARELGVGGFVSEYVRAVENTDEAAQPRRVHALLVLPVGPARPAADLVQVAGVPRRAPCASRAPCCASSASSSTPETEIRIWDSSSDLRYIVLPQRPDGTDELAEDELAALVTRESMIGTGLVQAPASMSGGVDPAIAQMENLPRRNGELVFEAPWQARAFGIAVALCQEQGIEWDAFRSNLIDEIATWERDHAASGTERLGLLRALARLARAVRARARARGRRRGRGAGRAHRARRQPRPRPRPLARPERASGRRRVAPQLRGRGLVDRPGDLVDDDAVVVARALRARRRRCALPLRTRSASRRRAGRRSRHRRPRPGGRPCRPGCRRRGPSGAAGRRCRPGSAARSRWRTPTAAEDAEGRGLGRPAVAEDARLHAAVLEREHGLDPEPAAPLAGAGRVGQVLEALAAVPGSRPRTSPGPAPRSRRPT